jgi:protein tyrosine phosphatase (PTP) superfamily phosphohydrolase (DUF442 family)
MIAAMPGTPAAAAAPAAKGRRSFLRALLYGCGSGLLLVACGETANVFVGHNFHVVIPGRVFRSAQQSGPGLEQLIRAYGIRTVINLRGCCAPWPWYLDECRATTALDVNQEDICLSSGRLPSVHELRRLVEVFDRTEYPVLLHCRRGADRTGLASAVALLLQTDIDLASARRQMSARYGHIALGRPAFLDRFFDLYADWLRSEGLTHSRAAFRRWAETAYEPGECCCRVEPIDVPERLPVDRPAAVRVRVCNTSRQPWRLRPGTTAGIHARYALYDDLDHLVATDRSGLFDAVVAPGACIDLTLALPALRAGRYRLLVDMIDEEQCWFFQTGSEPLEREIEVRD